MSDYKTVALNMLRLQAETDKNKALTTLRLMLNHPAGIGDHSTGDLYDNMNEALSLLADATDRLDTLEKYNHFLGD